MRLPPVGMLVTILLLTAFMIVNPQEAVQAAGSGLALWAYIVVPALLPFFVAADLLVGLGLVRFLGVLLEPVMQPLFRLPGCSSVVVAMGFSSGFPMGAILTRRLYEDKMLTLNEAERLVSFTNNSSPLFIVGAVGVGMFGAPALGWILAISHYTSNLMVGLGWRFRGNPKISSSLRCGHLLYKRAKDALVDATHDLNMGQLINQAVKSSLSSILSIGVYIMLFSVLTRLLSEWGIMHWFALGLSHGLVLFHMPYQIAYGIGMGLCEITVGSKVVAGAADVSVLGQLIAVSAILAFSGWCIITQVMGVMAGIPIRTGFYLRSRLLQMGWSTLFTAMLYTLWASFAGPVSTRIMLPSALYSLHAWRWSVVGLAAVGFVLLAATAAVLSAARD